MKPALDTLSRLSRDSLTHMPHDSLDLSQIDTLSCVESASEPVRPVLDSLWSRFSEATDTLQHGVANLDMTAMDAFGPASRLVAKTREVIPYVESLTDHPIYQGIILLLAVAYALMVCAHLHDIVAGFSRIRSGEPRPTGGNLQAIHTSAVIGVLLIAALVVRLCEGTLGEFYGTMSLLIGALAACAGILLFQCGLLYAIGRVVLMRDLSESVIHLKILHFSVGTLVLTPPTLLLLLCPPNRGFGWLLLLLIVAGMVISLFVKETFCLFMAKKVSILHWFLYLCAVETFPISLVWLLAVRW